MAHNSPSLPPRRQPQRREPVPANPPTLPRRRKRGKSSGSPMLVFVGGAVVLAALFAGGVYAVRQFGGGGLPGVSGAGLPSFLSDSPSAVIGDFVKAINDTQATLASVTDEKSRDAAVTKFEAIAARLSELQRRAVLVDPIPEKEFKAVANQYEGSLKLDGFEGQAQRLKDAGLLDDRLTGALQEIGLLLNSTLNAVKAAMVAPPEPRDEFESLARDRALLKREVARALARIESVGDIPKAVADLNGLAGRFDELARRKTETGARGRVVMPMADVKFQRYGLDPEAGAIMGTVTAKYGDQPELSGAYVKVNTASSRYDFAVAGSAGSSQGASGAGGGPQTGPMGPGGGYPQGFGGPPGATFSGRPGPPPRGGPPVPEVAGQGRLVVIVSDLNWPSPGGLHGEEFNTVRAKRREAQQELTRRLHELGMTRTNNVSRGQEANVSGDYDGDVQAFADRIDWGTVTEVDAEKRTIKVRMTE